jgi:thiamine-phosphate pyrophosphorylase
VNDRADIAAAVGADGVHLGQDDLSVKDARAIVGTRTLIGVSTRNIDQARTAVLDGANYLGAGPTFTSRTKNFDEFAGLDYLRDLAKEIRLPSYAIGGISADNVAEVIGVGVSRIAVSSAVVGEKDPAGAARELLSILTDGRHRAGSAAQAVAPPQSLIPSP